VDGRGGSSSIVAVGAAVAAAGAAVTLLRPRERGLAPAPIDLGSYFTAGEIERARAFRRPQLALGAASAALDAGLLGALVARPPRALAGSRRRPVAAAAATGAALSVGLAGAGLPLAAAARRRSLAVGLATQSWRGWAGDLAKATTIGAGLAGGGAAAAVALMQRFGARWWLPASAAATGFGALVAGAGPVVLDPIFNRFTPLPDGPARTDVLELAGRAGVQVGEVFAVDASRRTTGANAYVTGLGPTKRVVLFDTLLEHFTRDEVRLVVAHELAHVRHRDVLRGIGFSALVAPAATAAVARLADRLAPGPSTPVVVPALALATGLVAAPVGLVANRLSRRLEVRADLFSLRLTGAPEPFISFERRIAVRNLADPAPPRWLTALLATHPSTAERIGLAVAFSAERRERQELPADRPTPAGS
jgi:Zn-dependent protease with chaperone function